MERSGLLGRVGEGGKGAGGRSDEVSTDMEGKDGKWS